MLEKALFRDGARVNIRACPETTRSPCSPPPSLLSAPALLLLPLLLAALTLASCPAGAGAPLLIQQQEPCLHVAAGAAGAGEE